MRIVRSTYYDAVPAPADEGHQTRGVPPDWVRQ
jgi:hypothetical protein